MCFVFSQKKHENKQVMKKEKMEEENIYQVILILLITFNPQQKFETCFSKPFSTHFI